MLYRNRDVAAMFFDRRQQHLLKRLLSRVDFLRGRKSRTNGSEAAYDPDGSQQSDAILDFHIQFICMGWVANGPPINCTPVPLTFG